MNEKISNKLLAIPIALSLSIIAIFCFFCIGLSKVEAQSYYFSNPSLHRICANTTINNSSTGCTTNNYQNWVSAIEPGTRGNYLQVAYRMNTNNNGVQGSTYLPGNYSLTFSGFIETIPEADISIDKIKLDLIYYPNSSNTYGKAVCDNDETFRVTKTEGSYGNRYDYSYSCETLTITEGKSFIGYELYINNPGLVEYIQWSNINTNMSLIGAGDANNNDVINNQNQNTQDIINNATQNTDKITDAIEKSEETNQGILDTITNFFSNFFDGLIGIFVPSNFDFLTGFLDTLENKLGFIASVPIQFLEFLANLVTIDFDTVTSVSLPHFEILGYTFIDEQEIDLSEIMAVFEPYRIYTNIGCVCLCIRYLMKLYENFANKE